MQIINQCSVLYFFTRRATTTCTCNAICTCTCIYMCITTYMYSTCTCTIYDMYMYMYMYLHVHHYYIYMYYYTCTCISLQHVLCNLHGIWLLSGMGVLFWHNSTSIVYKASCDMYNLPIYRLLLECSILLWLV